MARRDRFKGEKERVFREVSPGELYKGIKIPSRDFMEGETRLEKTRDSGFVRYCKWAFKAMPSLGKGAKFQPKYREAIAFLDWPLSAEEFNAGAKLAMLLTMLAGAIAFFALFFTGTINEISRFSGMPELTYIYIFFPVVVMVFLVTNYVQKFPLAAAEVEKTRALTYVPEIIGYMIMSMKLVPNLEKAVEFAADHGRGKIAEDFRKIMWEVQLGVHTSLSSALDDLAYRWGKFSSEFKTGLMMIRSSVLETTEAKRYQILDKTMTEVLDSIRNKMEQYARSLSQPTIILFYIGVLLPLILIIILPVGSAFTNQPMAQPFFLVIVYNIAIPIAAILFARNVLKKRPPTYEPPVIPEDSPLVPPKNRMRLGSGLIDIRFIVVVVLVAGFFGSLFLSSNGIVVGREGGSTAPVKFLPPDQSYAQVLDKAGLPGNYFDVKGVDGATRDGTLFNEIYYRNPGLTPEGIRTRVILERDRLFLNPQNDITPYNLLFGLLITVSVAVFVFLYFNNIYKRKVQLDVMQMESEFKDALYVLASRMGENKPVEEALKHAKEFLPSYRVSTQLFGKTVDNISLLGMPLEAAVFDPNYGAIKFNPSNVIRSSMKILVDSVQLGVNVAARTLISLSLQLSNSEKVNKLLSTLVQDITSMMKTMAVFIAPVVLGITTALQRIVVVVLGGIASSNSAGATGSLDVSAASEYISVSGVDSFISGAGSFGGFIDAETIQQIVSPSEFILIVAIYVIQIVVILMYFTTKIEEDNPVLARINIARALPIAVIVFVVSVVLARMVVGGFT